MASNCGSCNFFFMFCDCSLIFSSETSRSLSLVPISWIYRAYDFNKFLNENLNMLFTSVNNACVVPD